jgi:holliday junction DNA helicase RuvA
MAESLIWNCRFGKAFAHKRAGFWIQKPETRYDTTMIAYLKGVVLHKETSFIILETGGVGYKVFTTTGTAEPLNEQAELWIHTVIREDAQELYGFLTHEELEVFERLISVSGIGPKTALGILNAAGVETLRQAVAEEKVGLLTTIAGIGKKNAEKIIIELRGKLEAPKTRTASLEAEQDAIAALAALGYSHKEARDALKLISPDIVGASERLKYALKELGSKK